jgi:hypothetical protein
MPGEELWRRLMTEVPDGPFAALPRPVPWRASAERIVHALQAKYGEEAGADRSQPIELSTR